MALTRSNLSHRAYHLWVVCHSLFVMVDSYSCHAYFNLSRLCSKLLSCQYCTLAVALHCQVTNDLQASKQASKHAHTQCNAVPLAWESLRFALNVQATIKLHFYFSGFTAGSYIDGKFSITNSKLENLFMTECFSHHQGENVLFTLLMNWSIQSK